MNRRQFTSLPLLALPTSVTGAPNFSSQMEADFLQILHGYLAATAKTSAGLAACEFPDATVTRGFLTRSKLSVTAVTRMMPAIAAGIVSGRKLDKLDLKDVLRQTWHNAFNPSHPDYWMPAAADKADQRQVEASIVAWSVWLLRDRLLPELTTEERRRISEWLESCTKYPVRNNNWAWFTAVNQAVRLALADKFPEFHGDERGMLDDLKAIDALAVGGDGWYSDGKAPMFDYYNSWVFASHFLYWNRIIGSKYPEWSRKFGDRLKGYLQHAPEFFGANGSHILYGRSLIYRWAVLTPLVLAYQQNLWPHSAGLLQAIVKRSLAFHMGIGSFDEQQGKLRETYSAQGARDIREEYIDGGHPYWSMQAFAMFLIPAKDAFWSAREEPLPVERASFTVPIASTGMLVKGEQSSGQVRLYQVRSTRNDVHYRDKYGKFSYSSHFPFCVLQSSVECPWDNALVLLDGSTGRRTGRSEVKESRILADGVEMSYTISLGSLNVPVSTWIVTGGEFEGRIHRLDVVGEVPPSSRVLEGSSALGISPGEEVAETKEEGMRRVQNAATGLAIASWKGSGWERLEGNSDFGLATSAESNVIYPRFTLNTLSKPLASGALTLVSVHYASPKPLPDTVMQQQAIAFLAQLEKAAHN